MNDLPLWIQTGAGYFLRVQFVPVARNHGRTTKKPRIPAGLEQAMRPAPVAFKTGTARAIS